MLSPLTITQHFTEKDTIRELTADELQLGKLILQTNLAYNPTQKLVIVTDQQLLQSAAAIWFESAKSLSVKDAANRSITLLVIDGLVRSGQEPTAEILNFCYQADVLILHTTFSLTHTNATKAAKKNGQRVASLPGVTHELMMRTLSIPYQPIANRGKQLKEKIETGTTITVTSPQGTHITAQIRQKHVYNDGGLLLPGDVGNLPAGEVFFAPIEGTTNGTWVVNGSLADDEPGAANVVLTIKDGRVITIDGHLERAKNFRQTLQNIGDAAFEVAEIGIGTNPAANPLGPVIEAEKALGTAHLAVGNNAFMGGTNTVPIHLDGVTLDARIMINGKEILIS